MKDREKISEDDFHDSRGGDLYYFNACILKLMNKTCIVAGNIVNPIDEFVIGGSGERYLLKGHSLDVTSCVISSDHEVKVRRE